MADAVVLGLNFTHDSAASVVRNGRLVAAVSRERISRIKKVGAVTRDLVDYVLDVAKVRLEDVDVVASSNYSLRYEETPQFPRLFLQNGQGKPDIELRNNLIVTGPEPHYVMQCRLGEIARPHVLIQHHLAHAAAAYYTSPFQRAACLSIDSSGPYPDWSSLFALGDGSKLAPMRCPGIMIGNAYGWFCEWLGLGPSLHKAGTLMGLAAYGKPSSLAREKALEYGRSWFERGEEDDMVWCRRMWSELTGRGEDFRFSREESASCEAQNIAASIQHVLEEVLVSSAAKLYEEALGQHDGNLCLSGGTSLNCDANAAILDQAPFKTQHLFPGCGDDGIAVGAALYAAHMTLGLPRVSYEPFEIAYLGRSYAPPPDFGSPLDLGEVARVLAAGGVVAWFRGRSEFGPRALGNRSLLADPRSSDMRDRINFKIKNREWFRPFAPVVPLEDAADWFDLKEASPYMLRLARVLKPLLIPAVSHVDGTARVQTLRRQDNPGIYDLLRAFGGLTGVPVLLNTSLNGNGEPLCETPQDAIRFFGNAPIDMLVIEDRMQSKR